jgi:flagellar hook assembly protein FlgD
LFALNGCNLPTALDDPTLVSNLRFFPSAFDSFRRNTEIRYTLKAPATVSIFIMKRDSAGQEFLVKTLVKNANETKGAHAHTWLGDTNQGQFAPLGGYIGAVQIQHKRFEAAVLVFHF